MKIAIHNPNFTLPGGPEAIAPVLAATARAAEEGGASTFTLMDHYFQMELHQTSYDPMLEGYTGLGFVAAHTEKMKLGLLVTGVTYRHPGLLAKIVTTLDVLSEGRAFLGIGAAWYEREHLGLGVPYPPLGERFERLEEAIQICNQMWGDDEGPYAGKHFQLAETICQPPPVQTPRPPILIGGNGERKTLKLVARYADACNLFASGAETAAPLLEILKGHCADGGRDYDAIQKTITVLALDPVAQADEFLANMEECAKLGIDQVWFSARTDDPAGWVTKALEKVGPKLAELGPA